MLVPPVLVALVAGACSKDDRTVCTTLGRTGGLLQSYDTVLSIAIQPEALDEDREFCVSPTDAPPEIFGAAYRVEPGLRLNFDAVVSYRGALPDDLGDANVGHISARDFTAGKGRWVSLDGCRVDAGTRHVQCIDNEVSLFYGLMDERIGATNDTLASDTSGDTLEPTTDDPSMVTVDPSATGDTPLYPPECDTLFRGPYTPVSLGNLFESGEIDGVDAGAEDMAADGHGGFIARNGPVLARLDVTGGTLGTENDPGMVVSELADSPNFTGSTLGLRYAPGGELVMAQRTDNELIAMAPDGSRRTLVEEIGLPNGVFIDTDSTVYFTAFADARIFRLDLDSQPPAPVELGTLTAVNGVYFDRIRRVVFYVSYDSGEVWRLPLGEDGTPGTPAPVAALGGAADGLAQDVCGNLYVVDEGNGAPGRLIRVFMDELGAMVETEEILSGLDGLANASFGVGAAYGDFQTALFLTGNPGEVVYVDLQITGAEVPTLGGPPATIDEPGETTGTDSGGSASGSSTGG